MILDNNKRDFIREGNEETTRMKINTEVESHIIKVLTEHSYDDPLGSSIREAVSNAIDSVTEAGTNQPVIVSIITNKANQYELHIQDKGLGLDDAGFKKYIMGLGESTKRNSSTLLGGYGAGAKAWLAYTNSFTYICVKDGIERKYLIFKGEEFPESTLLHEKKTNEPNGVTVVVTLKNEYREMDKCKEKIKEQLAYLDNVYYAIPGFDNNYKVYRSKDFQFSDMEPSKYMHISLKNIHYPIDWAKIGLSSIDIPVALRFDDYDEIKPIFNRESIQYNSQTIKAIRKKIEDVSTWFMEKFNEKVEEVDNFRDVYDDLRSGAYLLDLFGKRFSIRELVPFSRVAPNRIKVKNVVDANFIANKIVDDDILYPFEVIALDDGNQWRRQHIHYDSIRRMIRNDSKHHYRGAVVLVDFSIVGHVKDYLRQKYRGSKSCPIVYVTRSRKHAINPLGGKGDYIRILGLTHGGNSAQDLQRIADLDEIVNQYERSFTDERGANTSTDYTTWLDNYKAALKAGQVKKTSVYVALDKEADEITVYKSRLHKVTGVAVAYDKNKMKIEDLKKMRHQVVYCAVDEEGVSFDIFTAFKDNKLFFKLNPSEMKHVENLPQFTKLETFMKSKPMAVLASCLKIMELFEVTLDTQMDLVAETFADVQLVKNALTKYLNEKQENGKIDINRNSRNIILQYATENGLWDSEIYPAIKKYEYIVKKFGFLSLLKDGSSWRTSETQKALIRNMTYIMLKHNKMTGKTIEDFDLVEKEKPAEEETEESEQNYAVA